MHFALRVDAFEQRVGNDLTVDGHGNPIGKPFLDSGKETLEFTDQPAHISRIDLEFELAARLGGQWLG